MRAAIAFKDGVRFPMVLGPIWAAIEVAAGVYYDNDYEEMVVTSLLDGTHSRQSLHWSGAAADLRTSAMGISLAVAEILADGIRSRLPAAEFDVVVESDHIHMEWQPKR